MAAHAETEDLAPSVCMASSSLSRLIDFSTVWKLVSSPPSHILLMVSRNLPHSPVLDRRNCSAVNDVFASGDRGSTVRCQKRHQLGDFVRAIRPAERDA